MTMNLVDELEWLVVESSRSKFEILNALTETMLNVANWPDPLKDRGEAYDCVIAFVAKKKIEEFQRKQ